MRQFLLGTAPLWITVRSPGFEDKIVTAAHRLIEHSRDTLAAFLPLCTDPGLPSSLFRDVVGPHLRHVLDHYDMLLAAWSQGDVVDYDRRCRDTRSEQDRSFAAHRLRRLLLSLEQLQQASLALPLTIATASDAGSEPVVCNSTLGRELLFLQSHAIHHQAVIRAAAQHAQVVLPTGFGKAPATLAYERHALSS